MKVSEIIQEGSFSAAIKGLKRAVKGKTSKADVLAKIDVEIEAKNKTRAYGNQVPNFMARSDRLSQLGRRQEKVQSLGK